jgi:hypothetical protein
VYAQPPPRRTISIRPQVQHQALLVGRRREQSAAFKQEYARRTGGEGTIAQGVQSGGRGRAHYQEFAKNHLLVVEWP